MFRKSRNGWIVAAVIVALLGLPPGSAEAAGGQISATPADLWSQLVSWLEVLWVDVGPEIDPNGRPQATANGDEGSSIDPFGRTTANDDEGSSIDPNGRPHATTGDAGSSIDPNG